MTRLTILAICLTLLGGACSSGGPAPAAAAPSAAPAASAPEPAVGAISDAARKTADETFATRCTPCHGPQGGGDGPASKGLTPPPRNFQDATWQAAVTDEHIEKIVQYGGAAVGKSPAMPPNPDLTADVVAAVREHIRGLKK